MRDPLNWSFPIGRLFGITIRIHLLFPIVAIGIVMWASFHKAAAPGVWFDATMVVALLFVTVLLHEFGHCFAGRAVGGEANEILMWPLGGLAYVDVPHSARANFITAAGGPFVNLVICIGAALALAFCFDRSWQPPWDPFWHPFYVNTPGWIELTTWDGIAEFAPLPLPVVMLARLFYVSWFTFLLNVLLIGFPLDGGRMFQCILWPYVGYRRATLYAVFGGFCAVAVVLVFSIVVNDVLPMFLAWFIFNSCQQEWVRLETGGEDSLFGYDFSQGYTSLERDLEEADPSVAASPPPRPREKKLSFWQRWLQRRAEKKRQREAEQQEAEERRMDELLDKIQRQGKHALTDEEQRFLKRVSERYKNRH